MLKVYVNYPNKEVCAHHKAYCEQIQKMKKPDQRLVRIDPSNISAELQRFSKKQYTFAANAAENDMWLELDFADADFEFAVLAYVHRLIGRYYTRLAAVGIEKHHCVDRAD